ncbi:hypothetical protein GE061_005042 [Apolygus lucorum]|uniref:Uncharacterized protein n=1 Tax=Apolygus lucorum TaxID=248454 RepID=A0A8S9WWK7_APOLU|nr:hypothetical protein GE061_005042 [Apolygus lucorum]
MTQVKETRWSVLNAIRKLQKVGEPSLTQPTETRASEGKRVSRSSVVLKSFGVSSRYLLGDVSEAVDSRLCVQEGRKTTERRFGVRCRRRRRSYFRRMKIDNQYAEEKPGRHLEVEDLPVSKHTLYEIALNLH